MEFATANSPHVNVGASVARVMRRVLYAMLPGVAALTWFFGWGVIINILIASVVALLAEALMLTLRDRALRPFLTDGSALVTAWLLAVALPGLAPWWLTSLGIAFAIIVAKHLYGGLGYNPFNPAMVAYVVLLISFPLEMSTWPAPLGVSEHLDFLTTAALVFGIEPGSGLDALTGATPLDAVKTQLSLGKTISEIGSASVFGGGQSRGWDWVGLAFLLGGLWLVYTRTAAWQIPVAMLSGLLLIAGLFYLVDPLTHASPWFHLFSGATLFGAFFIATDPVSASTTPTGRLVYGAGIGLLTYIIRTLGGYPDGVAFAVLLMNITAPTIDYYTRPRVFGTRES